MANLQHGGQYGICAQGQFSLPNDSLFFPDGPNSCSMGTMLGRRAYTTIDRSKPTAAMQLAAGAGFVKDTKIPLRIDFSDDVAGPFPANFLCFQVGGGPGNLCDKSTGKIYGHNPACSVPGSGGKSTTFSCTADYGDIPDGNVWACVIAADASIPDNPNGSNQTAHGGQGEPVRPELRRRGRSIAPPPTVAIGVASAAVKVGDLVSFQASATDATSGLAGAAQWTWGDNTGGGTGDAVAHTYTQAGTYEVTLTVTDAAGNAATAKKAITVTAPTRGGGGTTTPPGHRRRRDHDAPAAAAGHDAARGRRHDDGRPTTTRPRSSSTRPRSARARAKSIPVELTATDRGRVRLALERGARVIARASVKLDRGRHGRLPPEAPEGHQGGSLHAQGHLHAVRRPARSPCHAASSSRASRLARGSSARASSRRGGGVAVGAGRARSPTGACTAPGLSAPSVREPGRAGASAFAVPRA